MAAGAVALLLMLTGCLEPAMGFETTGTTQGKSKTARCSALNCTGCCAGDVCLGGNTDDACGYDGRGCNTCPSTHKCEAPGACYPLPMPDFSMPRSAPDDVQCYFVDGQMRCQ